jgi:hypothetical protein
VSRSYCPFRAIAPQDHFHCHHTYDKQNPLDLFNFTPSNRGDIPNNLAHLLGTAWREKAISPHNLEATHEVLRIVDIIAHDTMPFADCSQTEAYARPAVKKTVWNQLLFKQFSLRAGQPAIEARAAGV